MAENRRVRAWHTWNGSAQIAPWATWPGLGLRGRTAIGSHGVPVSAVEVPSSLVGCLQITRQHSGLVELSVASTEHEVPMP